MTTIVNINRLHKTYEGHHVLKNINLTIQHGEFLTLLGPSGCGKTTLIRLIAGFETPDQGDILLQGRSVLKLPPNQRHVNTVFQSYALFPHMTIFENVAFGLRCQRLAKSMVEQRVQEALALFKLTDLKTRKPHQLSGGQQQRVAIARALVNKPLVLLLDEPLSSLDYRLRKAMQIELKQLQRQLGITFVFVTHDQEEALSLSDRIVVIYDGTIQQIGRPREVYEEPCNLTVAKFIGEANIFETVVEDVKDTGIVVTLLNKHILLKNKHNYQHGDRIYVIIRPEDIRAYGETEVTETDDMFPGIVEEVIYKGTTVDLLIRLTDHTLLSVTEFFDEDDENLIYGIGEKVWIHWMDGWEVILPYEN